MNEVIRLSKEAFFDRLNRSKLLRILGIEVTPARYAEWVKQTLAPSAERLENVGRKPQFAYGARHYRRALQVVRIYFNRINDTDAVRLQLFVRGYEKNYPSEDLERALAKEYSKAIAALAQQTRSGFLEETGPVPQSSMRGILKNTGPIDAHFLANGHKLAPDDLVNAIRIAGAPEMPKRIPANVGTVLAVSAQAMHDIWPRFLVLIQGMLALDTEQDDHKSGRWIGEGEIRIPKTDADRSDVLRSYACIQSMAAMGGIPLLEGGDFVQADELRRRFQFLKNSREYTALLLIMALKFRGLSAQSSKEVV